MGMFFTFQGLFQGSGHTKYSMAMEVGRLWGMRLPMILLFKTFTDIGSLGVWISMTSSNFLICVFCLPDVPLRKVAAAGAAPQKVGGENLSYSLPRTESLIKPDTLLMWLVPPTPAVSFFTKV